MYIKITVIALVYPQLNWPFMKYEEKIWTFANIDVYRVSDFNNFFYYQLNEMMIC